MFYYVQSRAQVKTTESKPKQQIYFKFEKQQRRSTGSHKALKEKKTHFKGRNWHDPSYFMWRASPNNNLGIWNSRRTKKQKTEGPGAAAQHLQGRLFQTVWGYPTDQQEWSSESQSGHGYSFSFGGLTPTPPPPLDSSFSIRCRQEHTQEVISSETSHFILRTDPFCWTEST